MTDSTVALDRRTLADAAAHTLHYYHRGGRPDPTGFTTWLYDGLTRMHRAEDQYRARRLAAAFLEHGWCFSAAGLQQWALLEGHAKATT